MYEFIFAGFGGQGVLAAGVIMANAGMQGGMATTWLPSYGAEQRGGTANCSVKLSNREVGSPYVKKPNILVVFNGPSLDKFESAVKPGGYIFYNSSLIDRAVTRTDVTAIPVDATNLASELGNAKAANVIMVGAVSSYLPDLSREHIEAAIKDYFKSKSQKVIDLNMKALEVGISAGKQQK